MAATTGYAGARGLMANPRKACVDCRFAATANSVRHKLRSLMKTGSTATYRCTESRATVTGERLNMLCLDVRADQGQCGRDNEWFEPKL